MTMTRTGGRILHALAGCVRTEATEAAIRFACGGDRTAFRAELAELEDAGLVVEDRHRRGVLVLTATGAIVEAHLS